jgi:hypothetical protein
LITYGKGKKSWRGKPGEASHVNRDKMASLFMSEKEILEG